MIHSRVCSSTSPWIRDGRLTATRAGFFVTFVVVLCMESNPASWWQREDARPRTERTMEAMLCCGRTGKGSKLFLADVMHHKSGLVSDGSLLKDAGKSFLELKVPPKGCAFAQIENYLVARAQEVVRCSEAAGAHPDQYRESRSLVSLGSVPWLQDVINQLLAQGAVKNEHAGLENVRPLYRVSYNAFVAVQEIIKERLENENPAVVEESLRSLKSSVAKDASRRKTAHKKKLRHRARREKLQETRPIRTVKRMELQRKRAVGKRRRA